MKTQFIKKCYRINSCIKLTCELILISLSAFMQRFQISFAILYMKSVISYISVKSIVNDSANLCIFMQLYLIIFSDMRVI